jgi:hypothetical protein
VISEALNYIPLFTPEANFYSFSTLNNLSKVKPKSKLNLIPIGFGMVMPNPIGIYATTVQSSIMASFIRLSRTVFTHDKIVHTRASKGNTRRFRLNKAAAQALATKLGEIDRLNG